MKSFRALSSIVLCTLLSASAAVIPAAAKAPSPSDSPPPDNGSIGTQDINDCYEGVLCLWEHKDFGGSILRMSRHPVGQCVNLTFLDNMVSSLYNRSGGQVRVHTEKDCGGWGDDYFYQQREPYLGSHWIAFPVHTWNDRVRSLEWF